MNDEIPDEPLSDKEIAILFVICLLAVTVIIILPIVLYLSPPTQL